ncbi:MAG: BMP family ABC transporter substrate-binding protein, partial [Butyricicoccaceae bacterium]
DYPIYGTTANINAFALGAKMVNPHAKIILQWSKTQELNYREYLDHKGISYISDQDIIAPDVSLPHRAGLYGFHDGVLSNVVLPVLRWGNLYKRIVQNYLNGGWKIDVSGTRAINYWWGMDAGVVDFICSRSLPKDTLRLINLVRDTIISGSFSPFSGMLTKQDGSVLDYQNHPITSEDIITMNWLPDNVIGSLPTFDQLLPEAQSLVRIQGIQNNENTCFI